MRGCFVTATDTGVGKTVLCAALVASLRARGVAVRVRKPVLTGLSAPQPGVVLDHELLAAQSGEAPEAVAPLRFGPATSPHLAAQLAGVRIELAALVAGVRAAGEPVVVEGIGGLLVPFGDGTDVRDLACALGIGVVIAARPGLGTINHTLLTLEAARAAGLDVRAVVMTPWPEEPDAIERSNRATLERTAGTEVAVLPWIAGRSSAELAAAADALPYERWLA